MIALQRMQNEIPAVSQYRLPVISSNLRRPDIYCVLLGVEEMTQQGFPVNNNFTLAIAVDNGIVKIAVCCVEIIEIVPFTTIEQIAA